MSLSTTINARPLAAPPSMTSAPPTHRPNSIRIPSSTASSTVPPSLVTPSPSESAETTKLNMCGTKEKVGRWSENEHNVFLEGLNIYGKQWKTIASMIGTRSVVQVRTHAQKYFQKMERKNQGVQLASTTKPAAKRKSLSSSSNLRKKAKKPSLGNRVASSPTLVPAVTLDAVLPASVPELPSFPSYVSSSSFSTNSDTWSSSPTSVATDTIDLFPDSKAVTTLDTFEMIGDDPLEWLLETGTHILPESSLPVFPDLEESLATTTVDIAVSNMVDPNVTMKSLFLPASTDQP